MGRSISSEMAGGSPGLGSTRDRPTGASAAGADGGSPGPVARASVVSARALDVSGVGAPILFVDGLHRSGTTVLASAVTEAVGGVTTTVGVLARHIPTLLTFLERHGDEADRGLDALSVTPETVEEYGFLVSHRTGSHLLYGTSEGVSVLREHVAELQAEDPGAPVILKSPHEVGEEERLLADFPDAAIIMMRRGIADVEASIQRSTRRMLGGSDYARALTGGGQQEEQVIKFLTEADWLSRPLHAMTMTYLGFQGLRLARAAARVPLHRVAFLSYEELRADPRAACRWAAHLVDPEKLAAAFEAEVFGEATRAAGRPPIARFVDHRWAEAWDRARAAQQRAGLVP